MAAVFCNNPQAYVIERCRSLNVPCIVFSREDFKNDRILELLARYKPDLIVLAGFLWLVPMHLIEAYPDKIINIHPALLPGYGGKGMYGMRVHEAVIAAGEKQSGITIHKVDGHYDKGDAIFQATVDIVPSDTPDTLAHKIHELEYKHFPRVIEEYLER